MVLETRSKWLLAMHFSSHTRCPGRCSCCILGHKHALQLCGTQLRVGSQGSLPSQSHPFSAIESCSTATWQRRTVASLRAGDRECKIFVRQRVQWASIGPAVALCCEIFGAFHQWMNFFMNSAAQRICVVFLPFFAVAARAPAADGDPVIFFHDVGGLVIRQAVTLTPPCPV